MAKIFISHVTEDKETVAIPLAELLKGRGLDVWLDQWELVLGDSLRETIEKAISQAAFGVAIISPPYMRKPWPSRELDGLFGLETLDRKLVLPVLHNVSHEELYRWWPMFAGRLSCSTDRGLGVVADQIVRAVHKVSDERSVEQPPEVVLSEYRRRMLMAADRRDLRLLLYELEDFLRHFPAHPQARFLKDEILIALRYEEDSDITGARVGSPIRWSRRASIWRRLLRVALLSASLGALLYLLYRLAVYILGL